MPSQNQPTQGNPYQNLPREVVITDIRMSFWSMVVFMVKWALASIPAMILLAATLICISLVVGNVGLSIAAFYREFFGPLSQ